MTVIRWTAIAVALVCAAAPAAHGQEAALRLTLEEAIASLADEGASAITVYPLFMAQGGHLKQDIPRILESIRASYPHLPICLESAVGEVPELLDAIAAWILAKAD